MKKMLCLIFGGRLVFAFVFIVSAWREYNDEGTWWVFNLNDGVAAEEYIIGPGIVMKCIIGLGIVTKLLGGMLFIFSTYPGAFLLLIYQAILSPILHDLYNREFIRFRQSYQHFLQIAHKACEEFGVNNIVHRKLCDQVGQHVNETVLEDDGMAAMCYYDSITREDFSQKMCDQINEIEKLASSNPLFTQSSLNTSFLPFIKGFGIVAALVFFITMKHKYGMLKKHKTN